MQGFSDGHRRRAPGLRLALQLARGLRRGELCGLRWINVDLDAGSLSIRQTRIVVDGDVLDSLPKTDRSRRTIPLDPALVALLRRHRATQAAEKLAAGNIYREGGWLVADEVGRPYHPDSIADWFIQRAAELDLRRIRLHDCRHTCASLLLAAGVSVKLVADQLGDDPATVLRTYAHVIPGTAAEATAALSASLLADHGPLDNRRHRILLTSC